MERLTNKEDALELEKDMQRILSKGLTAAPIITRYITLSEYEDTGFTPDEIKRLQKENAELQSQLSKAVELLELAEKYIPRQCDTCVNWVPDLKLPAKCKVGGCLDLYKPDRWQWQHAAAYAGNTAVYVRASFPEKNTAVAERSAAACPDRNCAVQHELPRCRNLVHARRERPPKE